MFISHPHTYCEEAMFVCLRDICISMYWVNTHIYSQISLNMAYIVYLEDICLEACPGGLQSQYKLK